jgi:hypothetical protein
MPFFRALFYSVSSRLATAGLCYSDSHMIPVCGCCYPMGYGLAIIPNWWDSNRKLRVF